MFAEMLSHPFMLRALLVGVLLSLTAALVGTPLVLRKSSMVGDGLSHAAFGAFAVAVALGFAPIYFALPVVIIASFLVLRLARNPRIHGDATIAILSAASLAIGTVAISVVKGVNVDLNSYLFGSILAVDWSDVVLSAILSLLVGALYLVAHNRIFAITFDEPFARSIGIKTNFYDAIFAIICSIIIVLGLRLLGALLISSLIIFPTLTAMQFTRSFRSTIAVAAAISVVAFLVGMTLSYVASLPTGATVVLVNLLALILARLAAFARE